MKRRKVKKIDNKKEDYENRKKIKKIEKKKLK